MGIFIFCTKNDQKFWKFLYLLSTLRPKKCFILGEFPMKNVGIFFIIIIFMSSLEGVHLISGIAHFKNHFRWFYSRGFHIED